MATYSRKNLVLGTQGPFSLTFPPTTNAQTLIWDASLGSFITDELVESNMITSADIGARDALIPDLQASGQAGVQVFVQDAGQGEYAIFVWDGTQFVTLATQDSAATDSQTVQVIIDFDDLETIIAKVSPTSSLNNIIVRVITPFDDPNATISIGDDINGNQIHMADNLVVLDDPTENFVTQSPFVYPGPDEVDVKAYLNPGTSTQGQIEVTITYS